jgi:hypothetical protein
MGYTVTESCRCLCAFSCAASVMLNKKVGRSAKTTMTLSIYPNRLAKMIPVDHEDDGSDDTLGVSKTHIEGPKDYTGVQQASTNA